MFRLACVCCFLLLGAFSVQAVPVNPSSPDGIAALYWVNQQCWILTTTGHMWIVDVSSGTPVCTSGDAEPGLPIPVAEIKDWSWGIMMSRDGLIWYYAGPGETASWHSAAIPCLEAPIPTENKTFGGIKEKYR